MRKILLALAFVQTLFCCTAFQLETQDGALLYCRSMEFAFPMDSNLLIVPKGTRFMGSLPNGQKGMAYRTRYGFVGMNLSAERTAVSDGMNEKGLVLGCLYMPGYAEYEPFDAAFAAKTIASWDVMNFILGTCANVREAKEAFSRILVVDTPAPGGLGIHLPLHYYISDSSGAAIVVEYVKGARTIFDNPLKVLTNSPTFDWHMANLPNYIKMSPDTTQTAMLKDYPITFPGVGSGFQGLPGDYGPPSRFIRAAFFSHFAETAKTADRGVILGFHLLNTFDIFEGAIEAAPGQKEESDLTQWTVVHDQANLKTYFRGYDSLLIQKVDLKQIDFSSGGFREIALEKAATFQDDTKKTTPLKDISRGVTVDLGSDLEEVADEQENAAR